MLKIALIRHAKTAGNLTGCYIGKTDEHLCKEGIEELKSNIDEGIYPECDYLYSSGMIRCVETAKIVYPQKKGITVENLNECDFGDFEQKNYEQLKDHPIYQYWLDGNGTIPFPNGEEPKIFRPRCQQGFSDICSKHSDGDSISIVCHGGTIMAILEKFGDPVGDFYRWQVKNTHGFTLDFDETTGKAINIVKF